MDLAKRRNEITENGKRLTNFPNSFKASKGWFDKFLERYNINIDEILNLKKDFKDNPELPV